MLLGQPLLCGFNSIERLVQQLELVCGRVEWALASAPAAAVHFIPNVSGDSPGGLVTLGENYSHCTLCHLLVGI